MVANDEQWNQLPLPDAISRCQEERNKFKHKKIKRSLACIELFRRAFANNQDAWIAIESIFGPLMRHWANAQDVIQSEDVVQAAWLQFVRYAPDLPDLVETDYLGKVLNYLKECVKTSFLISLRKKRREKVLWDKRREEMLSDFLIPDPNAELDTELATNLHQRLLELLKTEEERQIFHFRLVCQLKPSQIVADQDNTFDDVEEVYQVIQRIIRRLRQDDFLKDLHSSFTLPRRKPDSGALLKIEVMGQDDEVYTQTMDEECEVSEAILLDYITGVASAAIQDMVEQSAACRQTAAKLADELLPLLPILYRANCPDIEELIAYQEKRVSNSARFLVFHRHIEDCPLCSEEMRLLSNIDDVPLTEPGNRIRQIIQAVFQPALQLPQPVRGEAWQYHTPEWHIHLATRKSPDKPALWRIRGQARSHEGQLVTESIEQVQLEAEDEIVATTKLLPTGSFAFTDVPAGKYVLRIITLETEIVTDPIHLGDDLGNAI